MYILVQQGAYNYNIEMGFAHRIFTDVGVSNHIDLEATHRDLVITVSLVPITKQTLNISTC